MDVKMAFLNGSLKEEVYVSQPEGFINPELPDHVYRLKKALHGLKQAPHVCQSQYAIELLKKHGLDECVSMSTHMATERLDADLQGTPTDQTPYRHTLKEQIKYRLTFMLEKKILSFTRNDFRTIFHLPQATNNNHDSFVPPPSFLDMVPFYKNELGFIMELKTSSSFKTTGLLQPWQTLCKIFSNMQTTREDTKTSWNEDSRLDDLRRNEAHIAISMYDVGVLDKMRSTRLTPPALVPTIDKADEMILQDTLQVSLAEHKSQEKQEAREDVEFQVRQALTSEEIEKWYEIKAKEKGRVVRSPRYTTPTPIRCLRIHTDLVSSDTEKLQELKKTDTTPSLSSLNTKYLFEHLKAKFLSKKSFDIFLITPEVMVESLTHMVDNIQEQVENQVPEQIQQAIDNHIPSLVDTSVRNYMSGHILHVHPAKPQTTYVPEKQYQLYLLMKNNPQLQQQDIAIWLALQMKFETLQVRIVQSDRLLSDTEAYVTRESSGQVNKSEQSPSSSGNQEQVDDYDFWTESYASDDDEIPTKQVSQDIMEEVSLTINEAELKKITDEMLRQRCTLGDEHQYHIDQMKNFLKSDIRDPEAPTLSLINQDLLYLKKGNSGPEKIVLSLHKFPAIIFNDVDIEERTSRWVNKFEGVTIVSITEPDYKNLNKNDTEDMYLLIMNDKVPDYAETGLLWSLLVFIRSFVIWERVHDFQLRIESYQQKVNLTAPTISFPGVEKHKMFSIIYEPVHGIIYKNSKKEKRVMRHSEIHKELTNDEVEYLKLFEEEIEVRLKYRNQMRRWEMYVNGRPLGPRKERPE
ncbi:retrovirus-related pol polyprotein from transposon TNT 1-94 [Tanacetum coccineum]